MDKEQFKEIADLKRKIDSLNNLKERLLKEDNPDIGVAGYGNYLIPFPDEISDAIRPILLEKINPLLDQLNKQFAAL